MIAGIGEVKQGWIKMLGVQNVEKAMPHKCVLHDTVSLLGSEMVFAVALKQDW